MPRKSVSERLTGCWQSGSPSNQHCPALLLLSSNQQMATRISSFIRSASIKMTPLNTVDELVSGTRCEDQ